MGTKKSKPEGKTAALSDADERFAAGDYQAALKGYSNAVPTGFESPWAEAFQRIDQAACHLRLGDLNEAWSLHVEATNLAFRSTNMFNQYAWELFQRGQHQKARWLAECGLDLRWLDVYEHTANTLIQAIEALGLRDELLPELAMHQLAAPSFEDSFPLFERYRDALDTFWKTPRTDAQHAALRRHFHRIRQENYEALASAVAGVLERDPQTWLPEVLAAIDQMSLDWRATRACTAITDESSARAVLRRLLERWAEERISTYNAKPNLRDLVLGVFDGAPGLPADLGKALRSAFRKKFDKVHHWPFDEATRLAPLCKKLNLLKSALLPPTKQSSPANKPAKKAPGKKTTAKKAPAAKKAAAKKTAAKKTAPAKARTVRK